VCLHAGVAAGQGHELTLADVLARARTQAPRIVSARLALEETRGRLVGASLRRQANPELDVAAGRRTGPDGRFTDVEVGLGQAFEPRSRRSARLAAAEAAIAQGTASVDEVTTSVLRQAAAAYYRLVHANGRIALLTAAQALASNVHAAADRRFKAGDIAVLDVNIARAALARVKADREAAQAEKALTLGELRQLLALDGDVRVSASLPVPTSVELASALESAARRPEVRALEAAAQEADADQRHAASLGRPEYDLGVRYAREEGDQIVSGGVTVTLPLFAKGQEQRAIASARATRVRAELDAARARVQYEVRAAFDAHARRLEVVRILEAEATPSLDDNEQLATRSFEAGQIGLPALLLIRREILEMRFEHQDALLEAALARLDLDASAGMLR
jgi:cobalt-zinc-cadmium efflux system outer membrane protein